MGGVTFLRNASSLFSGDALVVLLVSLDGLGGGEREVNGSVECFDGVDNVGDKVKGVGLLDTGNCSDSCDKRLH